MADADHRGEMWYLGADSVEIDFIGDPAERGLTRAPVLPPPTADDVRREAQRRIMALMGARDLEHCLIKQLNANMRANEINDKRVSGGALTAAEDAEAGLLRSMAAAVKAIRAASNVLEPSPPADYADDKHWPSFGG